MWRNGRRGRLKIYFWQQSAGSIPVIGTQPETFSKPTVFPAFSFSNSLFFCGRNSETLEESVVYQAQYGDNDVWICPLSMFLENITLDGEVQPRFKRIK